MRKNLFKILLPFLTLSAFPYSGPLPDFQADWNNIMRDSETNGVLTPKLPGQGFDWGSPTPVDWNHDGLYDLVVGYNLLNPDSLKLVVFINQGSIGRPAFTGRASDATCFFVNVRHPGETGFRPFTSLGYHPTAYHSDGSLDNHSYMGFVPSIFDWNNDGLFDIFLTEGTCDPNCGLRAVVTCNKLWDKRGQWLLINTGTPGNPEFGTITNLSIDPYNKGFPDSKIDNTEFAGLDRFKNFSCNGNFPQVTLLDWNGDGTMDINYAVGRADVVLGASAPGEKWEPGSVLYNQAPVGQSEFGNHPVIRMGDFNGDGVNELVATNGQSGEIWLFTRPDNDASFRRDRLLLNEKRWGYHPKFDIWDWDEDGDLDMVVGWGKGTAMGMFVYRTPGGTPGSDPLSINPGGIHKTLTQKSMPIRVFPAPARGPVTISWDLQFPGKARLRIFDTRGRLTGELTPETRGRAVLNMSKKTGVYFLELQIGKHFARKKLTVIQ